MEKVCAIAAALALLCLCSLAQATVTIDTVPVGDPGNAGELSGAGAGAGGYGLDRICGSVGYTYNIGKYEVTAAQYCDFLNHKAQSDPYELYSTLMACVDQTGDPVAWGGCNIQRSGSDGGYSYSVAEDWADRPVNFVGFWDACRFANWLNNGQGDGDTETGAYTLNGYNGPDGHTIQRSPGAKWFVPTEDEWYKAAYYKGGGTDAGYWDYPTQSDSAPGNELPDPGNCANCYAGYYCIGPPYWRTPVGAFVNSPSAYGTFDQGGNVWEWNESVQYTDHYKRGVRGGSFVWFEYGHLNARYRNNAGTDGERNRGGFRVSEVPDGWVPEPSSVIALTCGLGMLLGLRRRRR